MNNRTKSIKNLLYSLLSQAVTIAFGLILPRLWVVSYGSEVNGLLSSLSQLLVYLSLFEAGIGGATIQALYRPVAQKNWGDINSILSASREYYRKTARGYLGGLILICIIYPFAIDTSLSFFTVVGAVFFSGIGNVVNFYIQNKYVVLLQTDGKLYAITNLTLIVSVLNSLTKVLLISLHLNIVFILAATFLLQCSQAFLIRWYAKRNYPHLDMTVAPDYSAIAQKNSVLVHQISALIFRNTDVLILTVFCGLKVVSVYSMFKLITSQLETVLDIPINSISFSLGQTFQTDLPLYCKRIRLVESFYSAALYALFSVALFLFLPFMRLYTAGVTDINYIDPWLALLFVVCSLLDKSRSQMLATIGYAGHYSNTLRQTIAESVINLATSLIAVYFLGIYGVLLGTIAALVYRTNDIIIYSNRKLLNRSPWNSYSIYVVNIVLFVLTQVLFNLLFDPLAITSYFRFALVGAASSILSLSILFIGQVLVFAHCRTFVKQLVQRVLHRA